MPEHVREALKPGGNIRAGMIPTNRVTRLVSYPGVLQIVLGSHAGGEGVREPVEGGAGGAGGGDGAL